MFNELPICWSGCFVFICKTFCVQGVYNIDIFSTLWDKVVSRHFSEKYPFQSKLCSLQLILTLSLSVVIHSIFGVIWEKKTKEFTPHKFSVFGLQNTRKLSGVQLYYMGINEDSLSVSQLFTSFIQYLFLQQSPVNTKQIWKVLF